MATSDQIKAQSRNERFELLHQIEDKLEIPMLVLSFAWLVLMIIEFSKGLSPFLEGLNNLIWILFVLDFSIQFLVAPEKKVFLKANLVVAASLALPALRLFRLFRAFRLLRTASALKGLRLARFLSSLNRGIKALGKSLGRRGFGYILSLTFLITFAGAAGMLTFEKDFGFMKDYGTAVWWTAMTLTTMGSDYFPKSAEGRLLCLLLATYGFAVFGYVTAVVASFFVGRDAESQEGEVASEKTLRELKSELISLREEIQNLRKSSLKS